METNKEIPTAEEFCKVFKPTGKTWQENFHQTMIEFTKLHLSKQAEVIAEKAKTSMEFNFGVSNDAVSKQSILQASEEYINNLK